MGAHTAALQPADSDSDTTTTEMTASRRQLHQLRRPHTAADAAADTTCDVCFVARGVRAGTLRTCARCCYGHVSSVP